MSGESRMGLGCVMRIVRLAEGELYVIPAGTNADSDWLLWTGDAVPIVGDLMVAYVDERGLKRARHRTIEERKADPLTMEGVPDERSSIRTDGNHTAMSAKKPCPSCGTMLIMPDPSPRISRHELVRLVANLLPGAAYDDWTPESEAEAKLDEVMPGWRERAT